MARPVPLPGYPKCAARYVNTAWNGQAVGVLDSPLFTPPPNCLLAVLGWSSDTATVVSASGGGLAWSASPLQTGTYPRAYAWWAKSSATPAEMKVSLTASAGATHLGVAVYALDHANTSGLGATFATSGYAPGSSPYRVDAPGGVAADSLLLGAIALTNISNLGAFAAMAGCEEDFGTGNRDFHGTETASPWPRRWSVGRITTGSSYGGTLSGSVPFRMGGVVVEVLSGPPVFADNSRVRPRLRYRTFRSDDLSKPLFGPVTLEIASISGTREAASFEAKAPALNVSGTGERFSLDRFPMLRGCL